VIRKLDPPTLRAAAWTVVSLRRVRRALRSGALHDVVVPPPPPLPDSAIRGVRAVLRRVPNTCLERSLLFQRWHASHGSHCDVVIGVTAPDEEFGAHAWLDGETAEAGPFRELSRIRLREPA
jgi:hypothetical protein